MGKHLVLGDGLDIHYEDHGEGDTIIFIPGLTCTTEFFVHNLEEIAAHYRVISYDPRSQGESSKQETRRMMANVCWVTEPTHLHAPFKKRPLHLFPAPSNCDRLLARPRFGRPHPARRMRGNWEGRTQYAAM